MGEKTQANKMIDDEASLAETTGVLLAEARTAADSKKTLTVPIAELATLGAGVSSLIPALHTVTATTTIATDGLYRIANRAVGDTLKMAKNGNAWGAMKTAAGGSKLTQLSEAGPIAATSQVTAAINPATMLMAVALYSRIILYRKTAWRN